MKFNAMLVGAGRRVSLAERFIDNGFNIISYETSKDVPLSKICKIIIGLSWKDPNIQQDILETAIKNNVKLIVPLQDEAVCILSQIEQKNKSNTDVVFLNSNYETSHTCFNKKLFADFITTYFPELYPFPDSFPLICKPVFGFSSNNITTINNVNERISIDSNKFILQKQIFGKEYSVDCYFDKTNKFIDAVTRERIRVAGGEVLTSKTSHKDILYDYSKLIGEKFKIKGPACFQYIIDNNDQPFIIEVNARFGGGTVLSMESGLDIISLIKKDYFNYDFNYQPKSWTNNLLMERYYKETFFN
jgi:carbamoyl-phosphate synthase large subunit